MLDDLFTKFTGFSWNEMSCKIALLSLKHPCAVAIEQKFDLAKKTFDDGLPEVLSFNTGRFGDFIVDTIEAHFIVDTIEAHAGRREVRIREVSREVETPTGRNDCCTRPGKTATMCTFCRYAHCDKCLRLIHFRHNRRRIRWNGGLRPDCACALRGAGDWIARTCPNRGAAYMVEVLVEDGIYELQPVFPRACYPQGKHPSRATVHWRADLEEGGA